MLLLSKAVFRCLIQNKEYTIQQEKTLLENRDPISFFKEKSSYPQFFWQSKDKKTLKWGHGVALCLLDIPDIIPKEDRLEWFVGGASHEGKFPWQGFVEKVFILPSHLYTQTENGILYTLTTCLEATPSLPALSSSYPSPYEEEIPNLEKWEELVKEAQKEIEKKHFSKVVLARVKSIDLPSFFDPYHLLQVAAKSSKSSSIFFFMPEKNRFFLSISPERLLEKEGKKVRVEAVAATKKIDKDPNTTKQLTFDLLNHKKDTLEFNLVKKGLEKALKPYSSFLNWEEDRILQTSHLLHRYNRLEALLKEDLPLKDLVQTLHPSAAVLGLPKTEALFFVKAKEGFERGWYASPLGWVSNDKAELAVGIRSILQVNDRLYLFSGAGIVPGSNAIQEWKELDDKLAFYLSYLDELKEQHRPR